LIDNNCSLCGARTGYSFKVSKNCCFNLLSRSEVALKEVRNFGTLWVVVSARKSPGFPGFPKCFS